MTIQDLGSIGELIAAIATIATLVYLAAQVRQNTRALRSSTFQEVAGAMSLTTEAIATNPQLAMIIVKGTRGFADLTPEERIQFGFTFLTTFRRLETVYVQRQLGLIDPELTGGFERSVLSILTSRGAAEWWQSTKPAFSTGFADYVDSQMASGQFVGIYSDLGAPE